MSDFSSKAEVLRGQSFAYALSPFSAASADSDEFVESDEVTVFIDEEGRTNVAGQVALYEPTDPIDCPEGVPIFSPENNFLKAINAQIDSVPIGTIILYPVINPRFSFTSGGGAFGASSEYLVKYPQDTPKGFVPCVGQVLTYEGDGGSWVVVDMGAVEEAAGLEGVAKYMQKVPEGWVESSNEGIEGKDLAGIKGRGIGGLLGA